jgi:ATP-dependent Clp protease ATP-binding subunit ClpA
MLINENSNPTLNIDNAETGVKIICNNSEKLIKYYGHKQIDGEHLLLSLLYSRNPQIIQIINQYTEGIKKLRKIMNTYLVKEYKNNNPILPNIIITQNVYHIFKEAMSVAIKMRIQKYDEICLLWGIIKTYKEKGNNKIIKLLNIDEKELFNK